MKRLLLVEDDPHSLVILGSLLKSYGYDVEGIDSGAAALELVQANHFDAILLDIMLPDLDGLEILHQLQATACSVPVIAMTGYQYLGLQAVRDGAHDYLVKPFEYHSLKSVMDRWAGPAEITRGSDDI